MNTSVNTNNIESNNGMSQVINILTGETKKIRCHYISSRTDKPVSRVLTLERLDHPALTAAGVTAWAERFNDGVNRFDWLRVSIQLTEKICYTPNCANVGLPDVENYGNLDYYMGQEGAMRVYMNNVDKFFQSIADKPAKMMTGEDWPNMAVIAAYRAAGRDEEADTLTTARDIYEANRKAKEEAWQKEWEEKKRKEQEKQNNFAEGMRVRVPAASLERNRDKEAFIITHIRRKAAENGGNASLTVKSELTGMERDINGSDVSEILPALQEASEITEFFTKGKKYRCIKSVIGNKSGRETFTKGQIYEQYTEPSAFYGWLRNNQGERHAWPQLDEMTDYLETWPDTKPEDIDPRLYFEPVEEITEAEGVKVGDKVRHNKHEEVATVTAIREAFVNGCDGYRYLYTLDFGESVTGPFDVELNGGEFLREAFTLQEAPEIKPETTDSEMESLTAKYAKQIEESALLGCGCMVGDGDETKKDSKCVKVRTAYKNNSHDPKDWTYCVSWYETTPIKGDSDGQHQTLRECENGILLEQAARHMAYFELMARKGWTLDEILYGKAA